jgi:hypothetical protein
MERDAHHKLDGIPLRVPVRLSGSPYSRHQGQEPVRPHVTAELPFSYWRYRPMSLADTGPQVWCGPQRWSLARLSLELHTEAFRRLASSMSSWRAESDCGLIRSSSGTGMRLTAPPDIRSTDSLSKSMWLRISDFLSCRSPACAALRFRLGLSGWHQPLHKMPSMAVCLLHSSRALSEVVPLCRITVYHEKGHPVTRHEKASRRDIVPANPLQWYPNTMVSRAGFEPATFV